jgi:hypothetical protein
MTTLTINSPVVAGARPPKNPERPLLSAASEKRRLVPHSWHRVALIPTSAPHAGQIFGRGWLFPPTPKNPRTALFHCSTRHCHR